MTGSDRSEYGEGSAVMERCHCGKPVKVHAELDGFTRGLCEPCDTYRCDTAAGSCGQCEHQSANPEPESAPSMKVTELPFVPPTCCELHFAQWTSHYGPSVIPLPSAPCRCRGDLSERRQAERDTEHGEVDARPGRAEPLPSVSAEGGDAL